MLNPCYVHGTTHVHGYVHACSCMFVHVKFWLPPEECRVRAEQLSPVLKTVKVKNATALHYACMAGNMDIIKLLIDKGASPGQGDWKGRMPMEYFDDQHVEEMKEFHEIYKKWLERKEAMEDVTTGVLERKIRKRDYEGFER